MINALLYAAVITAVITQKTKGRLYSALLVCVDIIGFDVVFGDVRDARYFIAAMSTTLLIITLLAHSVRISANILLIIYAMSLPVFCNAVGLLLYTLYLPPDFYDFITLIAHCIVVSCLFVGEGRSVAIVGSIERSFVKLRIYVTMRSHNAKSERRIL